MDEDHRILVHCYNEVFRVSAADVAPAIFNGALARLIDHTWSHFHCEESLMAQVSYPAAAAHKVEHAVLLDSAMMLQKKALFDISRPMSTEPLAFLRSWLLNHIVETDKELARFILRARMAGRSEPEPAQLLAA